MSGAFPEVNSGSDAIVRLIHRQAMQDTTPVGLPTPNLARDREAAVMRHFMSVLNLPKHNRRDHRSRSFR